ncbi:MAG: four helix bundle protein [Bacteroidia bacterium]|nr:four helix bundle protein [Bacteroidia bacterium]
MGRIRSHNDLIIYQKAFQVVMEIFQLTKGFPKEESYSLIDQIRRSSRSVAANLAEAFRRRYYPRMFVSKLVDCVSEAAETQAWLEFSHQCQYLGEPTADKLIKTYDEILNIATEMRSHPEKWQPF